MAKFNKKQFRELSDDSLREAVSQLLVASGVSIDTTPIDTYDHDGLMDLVGHYGPKLLAAAGEGASITVDETGVVTGLVPLPAAEKKVRKARQLKAKFAPDAEVAFHNEGHFMVTTNAYDEEARLWTYDIASLDETDDSAFEAVNEADLAKYKAPRARKEKPAKEPRVRRISDEIVLQLRLMRRDQGLSFNKLANWLYDTHAIRVTGDLIRSIVIGEIYRHVEMPEPLPPVVPAEEIAAE